MDYLPGVEEDENYDKENTIYIESRALLEKYQGKGIGSVLKEEFLRIAQERGYEYITGHIREEYVPEGAKRLSCHKSYLETGKTFVYYRLRITE